MFYEWHLQLFIATICQGYKHLEDKKSILPVFPTVSILLGIQKVLLEFNSLLSTKTGFKL